MKSINEIKKSSSSSINDVWKNIDARIKRVFNRDFFSIYNGIVEAVDLQNGLLSVRVPDLNNTLHEDCRIMSPNSSMVSSFKINDTVVIGFQKFSLACPIVLGYIPLESTLPAISYAQDTVNVANGNCEFKISNNEIRISNGISTITINDSGINLSGPFITANGEDLSLDDVGVI
jgi:hypothetical protein